jgi:T5SS/PEP-CTERM-associated repeat protein
MKAKFNRPWIFVWACAAVLGCPSVLLAVNFTWTNGAATEVFNTAGNWAPAGGPPNDTNDVAIFDGTSPGPATFTVLFTASLTNDQLVMTAPTGAVTFDFRGFNYSLDRFGDPLSIGNSAGDNSSLILTSTTGPSVLRIVDDIGDIDIGQAAGASGALTIGANARLEFDRIVAGSNGGTARVDIINGGVAVPQNTSSGSTFIGLDAGTVAALNVTGAGSFMETDDLFVGSDSATGTVTVSGGGDIVSGFRGILGTDPGGNGTVLVTGAGSTWDVSSSLSVGAFGGGGSLTVAAGGRVESTFSTVGEESPTTPTFPPASGVVTVTGADSVFQTSGSLNIGNGGSGTVNILSGGTVITGSDAFIGRTASSSGAVTVSGTGSTWDSARNLYVGGIATGPGGPGTLTIGTGATLLSGRDATHVLRVWGPGTVNLSGGTITARNFQVTEGTFNWTSGTLEVKDTLTLDAGATGTGLVLGGSKVLRVAGPTNVGPGVPLTFEGANVSLTALTNSGIVQIKPAALNQVMTSLANQATGLVVVSGATLTTSAGVTNSGEIRLEAGTVQVGTSANLTNQGLITGDGRINAALVNNAQGEVRAVDGERLAFTGASNVNNGAIHLNRATADFAATLANHNQVDVLGGFLKVTGPTINSSTGFIGGRDAVLRFDGVLSNNGRLGLSFGTSDVFGNITNAAAGRITVSGESRATFFDDVNNSGVIQISTGSTAVYFGAVSGTGSFPGGGTNFFEGDLRPGASPGITTFAGDVEFGTAASLEIEIGGDTPGTEHDQVQVGGQATLAGTLDLVRINNFTPTAGDRFTIMTFGSRVGTFPIVIGTTISSTLAFHPVYSATDLTLITSNPTEKTWGVDSGGATSVGANWIGGVAPIGLNESVAFTTAISANRTVQVDTPLFVKLMRFDDDNNYTIAGPQPITFSALEPDAAAIIVEDAHGDGEHRIDATISLASDLVIVQQSSKTLAINGALVNAGGRAINVSGAGATLISGEQTHGPDALLVVDEGTLTLASNAGSAATRNLSVEANSTTNFGSTQHLANLSIGEGATVTLTAGGSKVLVSNVPTIAGATGAWTGTLNLTDNDAVVQSSSAGKPADFERLYNQLKSGYATAAWNGAGINSSTAATDPDIDTGLTMIDNAIFGYTDFSGQTVNADSILLKYTYYGDIDVNGQVDADDLTIFANNFGRTTGAGQIDGDIDFDNDVDADDLTVFANNFGKGVGAPLASGPVAAVPEPAGLVLVGIAAIVATAGVRLRQCRNRRSRAPRY